MQISKATPAHADKTFMYFIGLQILFAICFFQLFTTIPLYFKEGLHINEFWIGVIMAMNGILIALFEMVIVFKLEGRQPYLRLMTYGTIIMAFSFFVLNIPFIQGFANCSYFYGNDNYCRNDCHAVYEFLLYFQEYGRQPRTICSVIIPWPGVQHR